MLVSGPAIFPIEFKCGERQFRLADYNQAWDYASRSEELSRSESRRRRFSPSSSRRKRKTRTTRGSRPIRTACGRRIAVAHATSAAPRRRPHTKQTDLRLDGEAWGAAPYQPTPTIIEAARALYARHSVEAISRHDAGAKNLRLTSVGVEEIIERARSESRRRPSCSSPVSPVPGRHSSA